MPGMPTGHAPAGFASSGGGSAPEDTVLRGAGTHRSDYLADEPRAAGDTAPGAGPAPGAPLDVNAATPGDLARLPGMTAERAHAVAEARQRNGPFTSVEQFAAAAWLQSHELVRLRELVVVSPPRRTGRRFGRPLDF